MASAAAVLRLAHQKRCRCENTGALTCAECDGLVHVVSRRTAREEALRQAVVEAARHLMAAELVLERHRSRHLVFGSQEIDLVGESNEALQTLRDACAAERRGRRGG